MRLTEKLKNTTNKVCLSVRPFLRKCAGIIRKAGIWLQKSYQLIRKFCNFRISQSLIPRKARRSLRYRLSAVGLAAVLLTTLTMGNFTFPINSARAETGSIDYDYSWLLHAGTVDDAYPIASPQALAAVADLVKAITSVSSQKEVLINDTNYIVSGGALATQLSALEEISVEKGEKEGDSPSTTESAVVAEKKDMSSETTESVPTADPVLGRSAETESTTSSAVLSEQETPQVLASNVISIPVGFAGKYFEYP